MMILRRNLYRTLLLLGNILDFDEVGPARMTVMEYVEATLGSFTTLPRFPAATRDVRLKAHRIHATRTTNFSMRPAHPLGVGSGVSVVIFCKG